MAKHVYVITVFKACFSYVPGLCVVRLTSLDELLPCPVCLLCFHVLLKLTNFVSKLVKWDYVRARLLDVLSGVSTTQVQQRGMWQSRLAAEGLWKRRWPEKGARSLSREARGRETAFLPCVRAIPNSDYDHVASIIAVNPPQTNNFRCRSVTRFLLLGLCDATNGRQLMTLAVLVTVVRRRLETLTAVQVPNNRVEERFGLEKAPHSTVQATSRAIHNIQSDWCVVQVLDELRQAPFLLKAESHSGTKSTNMQTLCPHPLFSHYVRKIRSLEVTAKNSRFFFYPYTRNVYTFTLRHCKKNIISEKWSNI